MKDATLTPQDLKTRREARQVEMKRLDKEETKVRRRIAIEQPKQERRDWQQRGRELAAQRRVLDRAIREWKATGRKRGWKLPALKL